MIAYAPLAKIAISFWIVATFGWAAVACVRAVAEEHLNAPVALMTIFTFLTLIFCALVLLIMLWDSKA
jgi:hypothetical protein